MSPVQFSSAIPSSSPAFGCSATQAQAPAFGSVPKFKPDSVSFGHSEPSTTDQPSFTKKLGSYLKFKGTTWYNNPLTALVVGGALGMTVLPTVGFLAAPVLMLAGPFMMKSAPTQPTETPEATPEMSIPSTPEPSLELKAEETKPEETSSATPSA